MDITKINSQADLDTARPFMTDKDIIRAEKRIATMANKPTVMEVNVSTVVGEGTNNQGVTYQTGLFTKKNPGKGTRGDWVSTWFRWSTKCYVFLPTHQLKKITSTLIQHIEELEAQGYKFEE